MLSNLKLFNAGNFEFRLHHLLIIAVLAISVSMTVMVRSQAADYRFKIKELVKKIR